jgi:hypothetical protein
MRFELHCLESAVVKCRLAHLLMQVGRRTALTGSNSFKQQASWFMLVFMCFDPATSEQTNN